MEPKNILKRDGTMETVLPKFINDDTVKVYINPMTGETSVGVQNGGESHTDYANSGRTKDV